MYNNDVNIMNVDFIKKVFISIPSNHFKFLVFNIIRVLNIRCYVLRMDTNYLCNLRCKICYFNSKEIEYQKEMDINCYNNIAEKIFSKVKVLYLSCYSEPFCSSNIVKHIETAKNKYKIPFVGITTNAQLLNDELIEKLIRTNIDEIIISMAGGNKETYEYCHTGASWHKLWYNIRQINKLKEKYNFKSPKIKINYILTKDSINEVDEFVKQIELNRIDSVSLRSLISFPQMDSDFYRSQQLSHSDQIKLDLVSRKIKSKKVHVTNSVQCNKKKYPINKRYPCIYPFFQLYINSKGMMKFCIFNDWKYDINKNSLQEILNKKDVRLFFKNLKHISTCKCIEHCAMHN